MIKVDFYRFKKIAADFQKEVTSVCKNYLKTDCPIKFIKSIINEFSNETESTEDTYIVWEEIPHCGENEKKSIVFLKKIGNFTGDTFRLAITWKARKIQTLFPVKEKNLYPSCKIYYDICDCGEDYTGDTEQITKTRLLEHSNP